MALWNTPEDIEERRAYNEIFTTRYRFYIPWEKEVNWIKEQEQNLSSESGEAKEYVRSVNDLKLARDLLYYRINVANEIASMVKTTLTKSMTNALKHDMGDAVNEINGHIGILQKGNNGGYADLPENEKIEGRKILALQVLSRIKRAVDNADCISREEIEQIQCDVNILSQRYSNESDYAFSNQEMKSIDYAKLVQFFELETGSETVICNHCGRQTTTFFNKCLSCGKRIGKQ